MIKCPIILGFHKFSYSFRPIKNTNQSKNRLNPGLMPLKPMKSSKLTQLVASLQAQYSREGQYNDKIKKLQADVFLAFEFGGCQCHWELQFKTLLV